METKGLKNLLSRYLDLGQWKTPLIESLYLIANLSNAADSSSNGGIYRKVVERIL